MRFYIGTHMPHWLRLTAHPLFISRVRLHRVGRPGPALGPWALDSGGFSEIRAHGRWTVEPARYADEAARWAEATGQLAWAAVQDWMCEPFMLARTGRSVREHQERTVASLLELRAIAPTVPWAPVLQGWRVDDYLACAELYRSAGVALAAASAVGVGSVCRRQATPEVADILAALRPLGLPLHGFGLKVGFLKQALALGLASADSMAWSHAARARKVRLDGCAHRTCSNCFRYAMQWRDEVLRVGARPRQLILL